MPTSIKVLSTGLDITQKRGKTTIAINTLYIEKGLQVADVIAMFNQSIEDSENRVRAYVSEEAQLRIDGDSALARLTESLETSVNGNFSIINSSLVSITDSLSATASDIESLTVNFEGLETTVTNISEASAGYFTYWNGVDPLKSGMLKTELGITYQYVAGNWIRYDEAALGVANQVKGWVAGASSLVVNPSTGNVTGWSYGDGSGFSSNFTISASKVSVTGETTFISNVVGGINLGTTTINGGKITTGTVTANTLSADAIIGKYGSFNTSLGTVVASITGYNYTCALNAYGGSNADGGIAGQGKSVGVAGQSYISGLGVCVYGYGQAYDNIGVKGESLSYFGVQGVSISGRAGSFDSTTGFGVYGGSQTSYGVVGVTNDPGSFGLYTPNRAYVAGGVTPFTGAHIVYTQDKLEEGQLVYSLDAWVININQTLIHVAKCNKVKESRVVGIVSLAKDTLLDNITNNEMIKPEHEPYIKYMEENKFTEVIINALGEGGILVCADNGDILNGDYLTSGYNGYAIKQDDDLLHSYTVGKALESVIWKNEPKNTKLIACTYHCG